MENEQPEFRGEQSAEVQGESSVERRGAQLRQELLSLLQKQVDAQRIDEREALLLSLRLGLHDGQCATLQKTGEILQISPEWVRQRQYFLLKKKIVEPDFFAKLEEYSALFRLPRGTRQHEVKR